MSDRVRRALRILVQQERAVKRKLQATAIAARYHADQRSYAQHLDELALEMTPQELGLFQAQRMLSRRSRS